MRSAMQFYSSFSFFSFFCPSCLPQDCPARVLPVRRPCEQKAERFSKGKTGACVLNRQRTPDRPRSRGLCPARRRFPTKHHALPAKRTPALPNLSSALRPPATPPARRSRTRPLFLRGRKTCIGTRLPFFSAPPHQICGIADRPALLRRQLPKRGSSARRRPLFISALPEAEDKKKTMPKHRLFLFNTPVNRRKHQSP